MTIALPYMMTSPEVDEYMLEAYGTPLDEKDYTEYHWTVVSLTDFDPDSTGWEWVEAL